MGKPVAFDASADERDTRGFISITTMRPSSGLIENWTLEPPVSTPISRSTARLALRMIWYSLSVRVCAGATVIESPVWTPIGSKFSGGRAGGRGAGRARAPAGAGAGRPSGD